MKNHRAPVDLLEPKYEFTLIEDFQTEPESERKVYFVRKIDEGQFLLKSRYNLRDRKYIGNSTMDPELAFIQANLIHAQPNALVLDPFTGTGLVPFSIFLRLCGLNLSPFCFRSSYFVKRIRKREFSFM